jgi:CDP-glucose 4,6-dehydratase
MDRKGYDSIVFERLKSECLLNKSAILVTGHTGFKGTWLLALLSELGIPAVGISLPPKPDSLYAQISHKFDCQSFYEDIRDSNAVNEIFEKTQPYFVIHLAAQALVIESYERPMETFETNVLGTANILNSCLSTSSVKHCIAVTTDKVYKNSEINRRFIESDPLGGADPYSASKVGSESAIAAWQTLAGAQREDLKITSVRAGNVIGGGDTAANRLFTDITDSFVGKKRLILRNPNSTRPWQHALDPLIGYLKILEVGLTKQIAAAYNFGPMTRSLSVHEVFQIAAEEWGGKNHTYDYMPGDYYESKTLEVDATLATLDLNWNPKADQKDAIVRTTKWWREYMKGKSPVTLVQDDINYWLSEAK